MNLYAKGAENMLTRDDIRETLEKQFVLLSERSKNCFEEIELDSHSEQIIAIAELLLSLS